jgi:hypothetical protein
LNDLDGKRTAGEWDDVLRRIRTGMRNLALEGTPPKLPDWFPKEFAPEDPAAKSPGLPAARDYVSRTRGLSAGQVEAMSPAQALLLHFASTFREHRDEVFRSFSLPYPMARAQFVAAIKRIREAPPSEGQAAARLLLSDLSGPMAAQARLERQLAALRVIEAMRMFAAGRGGKLPDKLSNMTEVPVPNDPVTGQPFEYNFDGETATVISRQLPEDRRPISGLRFHVTLKKSER